MKRKSQAGLQCITKFFKAENIGGKTPTSSPEKLFREQPEPEEEVLFLVDAPDPLELAMNRERGADFRGFRPQRFRGGMRPWGSARRGTLPVRRRPTRGFPPFIGSSGSDRSFHRMRPGDDRLQPRSQDKFRDDRPRLNSPDSDTESVASEFNANSARYKQSGIVGRQSSLTQANSPAVKRSESAKRHGLLETPARHGGQDIGHLNEQFGRQSLNESAMDDFVFVERRGRQGHIQRGLMRVVGGDSRGRIIGSPSFGRGRGFSGQRSTADNSGSWGTTGRDESPREKLMNRVPREKKQQASWIPLEEEEKKTTEVVQCATPEKIKVDDQCKQMSKGVLNPQVTCDQDFKLGKVNESSVHEQLSDFTDTTNSWEGEGSRHNSSGTHCFERQSRHEQFRRREFNQKKKRGSLKKDIEAIKEDVRLTGKGGSTALQEQFVHDKHRSSEGHISRSNESLKQSHSEENKYGHVRAKKKYTFTRGLSYDKSSNGKGRVDLSSKTVRCSSGDCEARLRRNISFDSSGSREPIYRSRRYLSVSNSRERLKGRKESVIYRSNLRQRSKTSNKTVDNYSERRSYTNRSNSREEDRGSDSDLSSPRNQQYLEGRKPSPTGSDSDEGVVVKKDAGSHWKDFKNSYYSDWKDRSPHSVPSATRWVKTNETLEREGCERNWFSGPKKDKLDWTRLDPDKIKTEESNRVNLQNQDLQESKLSKLQDFGLSSWYQGLHKNKQKDLFDSCAKESHMDPDLVDISDSELTDHDSCSSDVEGLCDTNTETGRTQDVKGQKEEQGSVKIDLSTTLMNDSMSLSDTDDVVIETFDVASKGDELHSSLKENSFWKRDKNSNWREVDSTQVEVSVSDHVHCEESRLDSKSDIDDPVGRQSTDCAPSSRRSSAKKETEHFVESRLKEGYTHYAYEDNGDSSTSDEKMETVKQKPRIYIDFRKIPVRTLSVDKMSKISPHKTVGGECEVYFEKEVDRGIEYTSLKKGVNSEDHQKIIKDGTEKTALRSKSHFKDLKERNKHANTDKGKHFDSYSSAENDNMRSRTSKPRETKKQHVDQKVKKDSVHVNIESDLDVIILSDEDVDDRYKKQCEQSNTRESYSSSGSESSYGSMKRHKKSERGRGKRLSSGSGSSRRRRTQYSDISSTSDICDGSSEEECHTTSSKEHYSVGRMRGTGVSTFRDPRDSSTDSTHRERRHRLSPSSRGSYSSSESPQSYSDEETSSRNTAYLGRRPSWDGFQSDKSPDKKNEQGSLRYRRKMSLPKPTFGYGRHVFSSPLRSHRRRSRARSVAKSKVNFYDKFRLKSKEWLRAQDQEIKAAEQKLIEESIAVSDEREKTEYTSDLVEATQGLQITAAKSNQDKNATEKDASQDTVIREKCYKMGIDNDSSPINKHNSTGAKCSNSTVKKIGLNDAGEVECHKNLDVVGRDEKYIEDEHRKETFENPDAEKCNSKSIVMITRFPETLGSYSAKYDTDSVEKKRDLPEKTANEVFVGKGKLHRLKMFTKPIARALITKTLARSAAASSKKSFWNDKQRRRVNKNIVFSPPQKPTTKKNKLHGEALSPESEFSGKNTIAARRVAEKEQTQSELRSTLSPRGHKTVIKQMESQTRESQVIQGSIALHTETESQMNVLQNPQTLQGSEDQQLKVKQKEEDTEIKENAKTSVFKNMAEHPEFISCSEVLNIPLPPSPPPCNNHSHLLKSSDISSHEDTTKCSKNEVISVPLKNKKSAESTHKLFFKRDVCTEILSDHEEIDMDLDEEDSINEESSLLQPERIDTDHISIVSQAPSLQYPTWTSTSSHPVYQQHYSVVDNSPSAFEFWSRGQCIKPYYVDPNYNFSFTHYTNEQFVQTKLQKPEGLSFEARPVIPPTGISGDGSVNSQDLTSSCLSTLSNSWEHPQQLQPPAPGDQRQPAAQLSPSPVKPPGKSFPYSVLPLQTSIPNQVLSKSKVNVTPPSPAVKQLSQLTPVKNHIQSPARNVLVQIVRNQGTEEVSVSVPFPVPPPVPCPLSTTPQLLQTNIISSLIPPIKPLTLNAEDKSSLTQSVSLPVPPPQDWKTSSNPQTGLLHSATLPFHHSKAEILETKMHRLSSQKSIPKIAQKDIRNESPPFTPKSHYWNKDMANPMISVELEKDPLSNISVSSKQSHRSIIVSDPKSDGSSSRTSVPQSPVQLLRDPRLRQSLEHTTTTLTSDPYQEQKQLSSLFIASSSKSIGDQSKPNQSIFNTQPKQRNRHLDAHSICLRQLKSILKSSLAKSAIKKAPEHSRFIESQSSQRLPFQASVPSFHIAPKVPDLEKRIKDKRNATGKTSDCDYSDVPMDIEETELHETEFMSAQPKSKVIGSVGISPSANPMKQSLHLVSASNTANLSMSFNKLPRDPRLQAYAKMKEETRLAVKTVFKTLHRLQSTRTSSLQGASKSLQTHSSSSESTSIKLGIDRTPESKKSSDGRSSSQQTTCGTLMTRDLHLQPKEAFFKNVQQNLTGQNLSSGNESKQDDLGYWKGLGDSEDTDVSSTSTSVLSTAVAPQTASKTEPPEGATRSFVTPLSFSSFEGTRGRLDEPSQTAPSSVLHRPTYDLQPVVTSVTSTSSIHTSPARHANLSKTSVVTSQCMKPEPSVEIPIPGGDLVFHEDDMEIETRSTSLQRNDKTGSNKNAERDFIDSVKPLKINQRSCSDQGSLNVSGDVKSPAHPSTSNNSPDMRRVGAHTMPLSFSSFGLGCQGPLSADKVRGLSHNDVSDWVKKSTKHQPFDSEGHSGQCRTTVKKKHRHRDKRRHCSGSSTFNRSVDKDINRTEGGKYGTKAPKSCDSDIQQLVDDSLRNKEILKSRSVDESDESSGILKTESEPQKTPLKSQLLLDSSRMSKFKANLAKSPLMKSKSPTKWAPDTSNPLGSYRIPKKSSAHDEDKKLKDGCKSKGQTKSEDDSSPASSSESDDDMLNETPAFLKEFEETSKAILNTEAMPGTPENENNESNQSDDSLFQQEGPVSCHPVTQPTDKSTFSLDTLLAEKVENEETDRELNVMQKELKDVIKKGGFVRLAEADFDGSDDELLPEHHQKLQHFQVSENTIQEHHPGDVVLHTGRFPCVYSESLTPLRCGLQPSMNFIERHLADIQPDALSDLLTTDMLSMCFHKLTSQKEVLRWIFLIMCVHDDSCVVHGCKKLIFDIIHSQLGVDETSSTWAPSITDLLKVLINFGGDAQELLGNQTLYSETDIREAVLPENDVNLVQGQGNMSERSYAENIRECLQTVAFALQGRPPYTAAELNVLLLMIAKLAMEKEFTQNMLLYEFTVVINSLLPCYQDEDWTSVMPGLCYQLSEITQHHHNLVYLSQLFHHSHRSSCLQRRLAYTLLNKMLQPSVTIPPQFLIHFKLRNLCVFFPMLRDLAADDLYALSSAICLMDIAVGNEPVKGPEKADLQYLMELLRTLTSDVRDNVRRLDHTRVKDLMVRISSKWTVTLQTTFSKQRNLFAWTKQKSPQKMKVQRLETGASDVESDEEEGEEESGPVPMEEDNGAGGESTSDIDTKSQVTQHDVLATDKKQLELDSGDAVVEDGDRTIKICANKNNQVSGNSVDKNSTLTISVSSSRNTDYIDNVNCDNHTRVEGNDVSSRQLHKDKTSQPGGRQGATIVIEDVLEKTDDVSMSSEDESLPELDISL